MNKQETFTVHDIIAAEYTLEPLRCLHCGSLEVTFSQAVMDARCADCGRWQLDDNGEEQAVAGSPWGPIQHSRQIARGFRSVSTAGHGGFMLTQKFAKEHLSPAAMRKGFLYLGYLCYEEDCDWAIPLWDLPEYWDEVFAHASEEAKADIKNTLLKTLSRWHPDYLIGKGVEPEPAAFARWQDQETNSRMREEGHPDLIVSAVGDHRPGVPTGATMVSTADGKEHLVKKDHYREYASRGSMLVLLSECEAFEPPRDPAIIAASPTE